MAKKKAKILHDLELSHYFHILKTLTTAKGKDADGPRAQFYSAGAGMGVFNDAGGARNEKYAKGCPAHGGA